MSERCVRKFGKYWQKHLLILMIPFWYFVHVYSCLALSDLLRGRNVDTIVDFMPALWESCLKVLDDIKVWMQPSPTPSLLSLPPLWRTSCQHYERVVLINVLDDIKVWMQPFPTPSLLSLPPLWRTSCQYYGRVVWKYWMILRYRCNHSPPHPYCPSLPLPPVVNFMPALWESCLKVLDDIKVWMQSFPHPYPSYHCFISNKDVI